LASGHEVLIRGDRLSPLDEFLPRSAQRSCVESVRASRSFRDVLVERLDQCLCVPDVGDSACRVTVVCVLFTVRRQHGADESECCAHFLAPFPDFVNRLVTIHVTVDVFDTGRDFPVDNTFDAGRDRFVPPERVFHATDSRR
jgi:hypothetical protein